MLNWLKADVLAETYRDPVSWAILAVDLFPIYALYQFGWDAGALVFLYWLENVVIGAITLLRMGASSVSNGIAGSVAMLFIGPFFIFHYGMFCFVHGLFLVGFKEMGEGAAFDMFSPFGVFDYALGTGAHMPVFIGAIFALQLALFLIDFLGRGQWRESDVVTEMGKPYGRIIVLHVGLFVGFAAMIALGQPFIGVLGLILLRALWGVYQTVRRHMALDDPEHTNKVDEASRI
ncbi:MAG: DUF6498-containing protein [Henriciella sp.]